MSIGKPIRKILNAFAGLGISRKLWPDNLQVTAVEINEEIAEMYKSHYPQDQVIIEDADQYIWDNYHKYDVVVSSYPCHTHTKLNDFNRHNIRKRVDLRQYEMMIELDKRYDGLWVFENVIPSYKPIPRPPTVKIGRHLFWSNFRIEKIDYPKFEGNYSKATKKELMDYYGYYYDKNIYVDRNHDPNTVLRNGYHPIVGRHIILSALGENKSQLTLDESFMNLRIGGY